MATHASYRTRSRGSVMSPLFMRTAEGKRRAHAGRARHNHFLRILPADADNPGSPPPVRCVATVRIHTGSAGHPGARRTLVSGLPSTIPIVISSVFANQDPLPPVGTESAVA